MPRLFSIILLVFGWVHASGQIMHYNIMLASFDEIRFASEPPAYVVEKDESLRGRFSNADHGFISIQDSAGQPIFHTDGVDFFNAAKKAFKGWDRLKGLFGNKTYTLDNIHSAWRTREVFYLGENKYLLIVLHAEILYQRIIKVENGDIQELEDPSYIDSSLKYDKITSVHLPGQKPWLITKVYKEFRVYPITKTGLGQAVISKYIEREDLTGYAHSSNMKISRDGKTLISLDLGAWPGYKKEGDPAGSMVYQYDFDNQTGKVSNQVNRIRLNYHDYPKTQIDDEALTSMKFIELAFSPNDSIIYCVTRSTVPYIPGIWQFDRFDTSKPPATISTYMDSTKNARLTSVFQAPNGKLYLMHSAYEYEIGINWFLVDNRIGLIEHPNKWGAACDVQLSYIRAQDGYDNLRSVYTSYLPRVSFVVEKKCSGQLHLVNKSDDDFMQYEWYEGNTLVKTAKTNTEKLSISALPGPHYYRLKGTTKQGLAIWFSDTIVVDSSITFQAVLSDSTACQWRAIHINLEKLCYQASSIGGLKAFWDFGDGNSSTKLAPKHIYSSTGQFVISGYVTNGYDTLHAHFDTIQVRRAPKPGILINDTLLCSPALVEISEGLSSQVLSREYSWSDGFTSTDSVYSRTLNAGRYQVLQILKGGTACISRDSITIWVRTGIDTLDKVELISTKVEGNNIQLRYGQISNAQKYRLERSDGHIWASKTYMASSGTVGFHDSVSDASQKSYLYKLFALDSCGTETVLADSIASICLKVDAQNDRTLGFIWNAAKQSAGTRQYVLNYSIDKSSWQEIARLNEVEFRNWVIPDLLNEWLYFQVKEISGENLDDTSTSNVVSINTKHQVFIPNAFSPNQDGINDDWVLAFYGIEHFECKVFSRSGQIVAILNENASSWNGKWLDYDCPLGVYKYVFSASTFRGNKVYKSGTVTILR